MRSVLSCRAELVWHGCAFGFEQMRGAYVTAPQGVL
jgi:hypothetical protein